MKRVSKSKHYTKVTLNIWKYQTSEFRTFAKYQFLAIRPTEPKGYALSAFYVRLLLCGAILNVLFVSSPLNFSFTSTRFFTIRILLLLDLFFLLTINCRGYFPIQNLHCFDFQTLAHQEVQSGTNLRPCVANIFVSCFTFTRHPHKAIICCWCYKMLMATYRNNNQERLLSIFWHCYKCKKKLN